MIHLRLDNIIEEPLPNLLEDILQSVWRGMPGDKADISSDSKLSLVEKMEMPN